MMKPVAKNLRKNLVHLCPSLSSDGHGSCKPRVPHLTPFLLQSPALSFPPMASSSTRSPDQPQYSAYTNVWQPNQRTPSVSRRSRSSLRDKKKS